MNTELTEIFSRPLLNINPAFVHGIKATFQHNVANHVSLPDELKNKRSGFFLPVSKAQDFLEKIYATDNTKAAIFGCNAYIEDDDQFINIINVNGPITRGGGACSIGSKQHRDQVQFALSRPNCIGNIFYIDTPGGSAFSKNDYAQAVEMIHNAGMKAYAVIDGNAYSAGQALAALCDEVYYTHEKDGFGCIGTMAAFYTQKNGDKNQYTNETYRELYDPESFDKNAEFRALANDDDETALIEELRKDGEEFRALVREHRPNVTDEMLHGKTYTAKEVEGILNDGKRTLAEMIQIITDEYVSKQNKTTVPDGSAVGQKNSHNMNTPFINACIGNNLTIDKENGAYFVETMVQQVEEALANASTAQKSLTEAQSLIDTLNGTITQLKEQIATLTQEKQTAIELNATLTSERDTLASEKADLATQLEEAKKNASVSETSVSDLNTKIAGLTQQLADRDAEIAELQKRGTVPPSSHVQEEETHETPTTANCWDPNKSYQENIKAFQEREAILKKG